MPATEGELGVLEGEEESPELETGSKKRRFESKVILHLLMSGQAWTGGGQRGRQRRGRPRPAAVQKRRQEVPEKGESKIIRFLRHFHD